MSLIGKYIRDLFQITHAPDDIGIEVQRKDSPTQTEFIEKADFLKEVTGGLDDHLDDKGNPHDVMHDQLTDVTTDQHHPQLHDIDSHTDVTAPLPQDGDELVWDTDLAAWIPDPQRSGGISQNAFEALNKKHVHHWTGAIWHDPITDRVCIVNIEGVEHYPSNGTPTVAQESSDGGATWTDEEIIYQDPLSGSYALIGGDIDGAFGVILITTQVDGNNIAIPSTRRWFFIKKLAGEQTWSAPLELSFADPNAPGIVYGQFITHNGTTYAYGYVNYAIHGIKSSDGGATWTAFVARSSNGINRITEPSVFKMGNTFAMTVREIPRSAGDPDPSELQLFALESSDLENWGFVQPTGIFMGENPAIGMEIDGMVYLYVTGREAWPLYNHVNKTLVFSARAEDFPTFDPTKYFIHTQLQSRYIGYFCWMDDMYGQRWALSVAAEEWQNINDGLPSESSIMIHRPQPNPAMEKHPISSHTDVDADFPENGQRLSWDASITKWVPKASTSGLGLLQFNYRMSLPPNTTPASGYVTRDNADPVNTTQIYLNEFDSAGVNVSQFWNEFKAGDWFNIYRDTDTANHESYDITGPATETAGVWAVPVTYFTHAGSGLSNNNKVTIVWRVGPNYAHSVLIERDAADSHPMAAISGHPVHLTADLKLDQDRQDDNLTNHLNDVADPHDVQHSQLGDVAEDDDNPHGNMRWKNTWIGGSYFKHDTVTDDGWAMVANKDTGDRPSPQPIGASAYLLPEVPAWEALSFLGVVQSGIRVSNLIDSYQIQAIRVWIPTVTPDDHYRVLILDNISGIIKSSQQFDGDILTQAGWFDVDIDPVFMLPGDDITVFVNAQNSSTSQEYNHPWLYTGSSNQELDPGTSNVNRRGDHTVIRINKLDNSTPDPIDRTAELDAVIISSTISITAEANASKFIKYEVVNTPVDNGTWYSLPVTLVETGALGEPDIEACQVYFVNPVLANTDYVRILNQWVTSAFITGILKLGDNASSESDIAYGIDLLSQEYVSSPDWDFLSAPSDSGVGSGNGGLDPHVLGYHSDVSVPTPLNGQNLTWNDTSSMWEASTPAQGVTDHALLNNVTEDQHHPKLHTLESHTDLVFAALANGQFIKFNGTNWVNVTLSESDIADLQDYLTEAEHNAIIGNPHGVTHAQLGTLGVDDHHNQVHAWDGSDHTGMPATFPSDPHALPSHTDVQSGMAPIADDILTWDGVGGEWIAKQATGGLVEYGASALPATGTIEGDVNAMDWSAHQHANGDSLEILENHSVTFGNDSGVSYKWVGPKNVLLGGTSPTYTAVAADFLGTGVGDHTLLSNIGLKTHAEIDSHIANVSNPHAVTYAQVGADPIGTINYVHPAYSAFNINTAGAQVIDLFSTDVEGHVTTATLRTMTLADLGYTGDPNANEYVHPNDGVDPAALTGASVFSDHTINAAGHMTGSATRQLTPADIGAEPAIPAGTYVLKSGDTMSGNLTLNNAATAQLELISGGSNQAIIRLQHGTGRKGYIAEVNGIMSLAHQDAAGALATQILLYDTAMVFATSDNTARMQLDGGALKPSVDSGINLGAVANNFNALYVNDAILKNDATAQDHAVKLSQLEGQTHPFSDITDTNIVTPLNGHFLNYDTSSGKWINRYGEIAWISGLATSLNGKQDNGVRHGTDHSKAVANVTQSLTAAAWTRIDFQNILLDEAGAFDVASNRYLVQQSGHVDVFVYLEFSGLASTAEGRLAIYKNGARQEADAFFGGYYHSCAFSLENLTTADYFEIYAYRATAGNVLNLRVSVTQLNT